MGCGQGAPSAPGKGRGRGSWTRKKADRTLPGAESACYCEVRVGFMMRSGLTNGKLLSRRVPARARTATALPAFSLALTLLAVSGCEKVNALIGRGGVSLEAPLKTPADSTWRVLVESPAPAGGGGTATISARVDLKIRARQGAGQADNWAPVDAEILEGRYEVDQKPRGIQLAGQKISFKISDQRRLSAWQGPAFPAGLELLEIAPPKGRVKKGERWKVETKR